MSAVPDIDVFIRYKNHPFFRTFNEFMLQRECTFTIWQPPEPPKWTKRWTTLIGIVKLWNQQMKEKWHVKIISSIRYYNKCQLAVEWLSQMFLPKLVVLTIGLFLQRIPQCPPILRRYIPIKCTVCKDYLSGLNEPCYCCGTILIYKKKNISTEEFNESSTVPNRLLL